MTPDDVRAADQLLRFQDRFAPTFGKPQAQDHAHDYVKGLMTCPDRKSIEPIALTAGHGDVSGLQEFINAAPWQGDDLRDEIQDAFADELAPSAARSPIGVVGVLDESCFAKQGRPSAGVARQHNGRLGKEDNCQVGVSFIGVTPDGVALLGHQPYLHKSWYDGPEGRHRRDAAHVPEGLPFRTKPRIAAEPVRGVAVHDSVRPDRVTADEAYGTNGELLDGLEELGQRYVMEVPKANTVWAEEPAGCVPTYSGRGQPPKRPTREAVRPVAEIAAGLPAGAWQALQVREGAVGPLVFELAAVRVWAARHRRAGPPIWLLIRRSLGAEPEVKYYVCDGDAETPLGALAQAACSRHRVEESFEDCEGSLGMAQYETRSDVGWHPHMSLVGLAHLFVTLTRRRLQKKWRG
jgi:SRSO17 transposase